MSKRDYGSCVKIEMLNACEPMGLINSVLNSQVIFELSSNTFL